MKQATVTAHPAYRVGAVERRLFGSFVEHMGRCVYGGIFEPGHPSADERGFRRDVIDLTRELGVTVVRYPGGNFVSGFRWEDSIGPVADRPSRLDLAWKTVESNRFGLHEFLAWVEEVGAEPMMAVNLGSRGVQAAVDLLEYCNYPSGTRLSDSRVANGAPEPFDIRLWCLGNEMDGPWQIGHTSAADYARLASQTARAMKRFDPELGLVACGSSNRQMETFGAWEATVLEEAYECVDYISAHAYYDPQGSDRQTFLCSSVDMELFIAAVTATADHAAASAKSERRIKISFDEWNVWSHSSFDGEDSLTWADAPQPLIEATYTEDDALVVASLLMTLLNHSDRVGVACQAQLVNVIAPIRTDPSGSAWRQTIFHPFAVIANHSHGDVLDLRVTSPQIQTSAYGSVDTLMAAATCDDSAETVTLFLANRDANEPVSVVIDLRAFGSPRIAQHLALGGTQSANPAPVESNEAIISTTLAPASGQMIEVQLGVPNRSDGSEASALPAPSQPLAGRVAS